MGNKKKHDRRQKGQDDYEQSQRLQNPDQQENKKKQNNKEDQTNQQGKQQQPKFQIIAPKKVSYCPACSLPFQLCRFGKNPNQCIKVLYDLAPTKVTKYHPQFKQEDIASIKKELKQAKKQEAAKQEKKQKTVKQKYIVIDSKSRGKKKHVTTISGLNIFSIDTKQFAKKLSKKFACSCSALDQGEAQIQGQFFQQIKQILIMQYKVKKKYIIDGEQYKEKFNVQMQKKKQQRKLKGNEIKQVDQKLQEEQIKQPEVIQGEQLPKVQEKPRNRLGFEIRSDSEDED